MNCYREPTGKQPVESVIGWAADMVLDIDLTQPAIPPEHWHILGEPKWMLAGLAAQ